MTDQNSQFFAILTAVGEAKQANADALGIAWKITQMGVGDANGTEPLPDRLQTALLNERRRAPLNQLSVDPNNASIIIAEQVIPADVGGWWIREIGLYDEAGDLVAIANCAPSFKPQLSQGSGRTQVVRMNLIVSSATNVELKIDPSVVLATRAYCDGKVADELAKLDHKQSVSYATTADISLNGLAVQAGGDWAAVLTAGNRVLVKNQALAKNNGIYVVAAGAWVRATDADLSAEVTPGLVVGVEQGATLADTRWQLVTDGAIVLGTTALTFQDVTFGYTPLAFGVGATSATYVANLDALTAGGLYRAASVSSQGIPFAVNGVVLHAQGIDALNAAQTYWATTGSLRIWSRYKAAGVWSAWREVWHDGNLIKQASATDTTAGAVLLQGAHGLGSWGVNNVSADLDGETRSGWVGATIAGTQNKPGAFDGVCLVSGWTPSSGGRCTQMFFPNATDPRIFIRTLASGGWTSWVETWHGGNLVKQASKYDATAGSVLLQGAHGLGAALGSESALLDFNDATLSTGWHRFNSSAVNGPPGSGFKIVNVLNYTSTFCVQIAYTMGPDAPVNIRFYIGGVWGSWLPMWHGGNNPASFGTNSYQKLASGGIKMFGQATSNASGDLVISLPTTIPTALRSFKANAIAANANDYQINFVSNTLSAVTVKTGLAGTAAAVTFFWELECN